MAASLGCTRVLDAVSAATLVHAGDRILFANPAMQRLLGYDQAALLQMHHADWATPETREALLHYGQQALSEEGELPVLEVTAHTASGAQKVLEIGARTLRERGQVLVFVTAQDLSDMRYVQQSLLDMGQVMHQIVANDPVPTFVLDAQHRVTHWNAACAQLTGIPTHQMLGSTEVWRAFYAQQRPMLADMIIDGDIAQAGPQHYGQGLRPAPAVAQAYEFEDFYPQLGENGLWLFFSSAPLRDLEGKVVGAIETLQDVTARRSAEEALRRHHHELERMVAERTAELLATHHDLDAFLENAPVGILATEDRRIVRHNKTYCTWFGLEGADPATLGGGGTLFLDDDEYAELAPIVEPQLRQGHAVSHETHMRTPTGTLWVQLIAYVADPTSASPRVWWMLHDRTAIWKAQQELVENYRNIQETNARLEEAQNQLLQSEKMASIGQLAAGVAHEINNPIGFVNSNLGSLRRYVEALLALLQAYLSQESDAQRLNAQIAQLKQDADLDYVAEDLPVLLRESEEGLGRVKKIVQDLKDFSRVDQADWQLTDLNVGLESTLNVVMNEVKYKADVHRDYGRLPPVRCLAGQLNQVFMNLIVNAAHAIPERGVITLRSGTQTVDGAEWAWVEVQDDGVGMTAEVQRRIFEPFYTTKAVGKGTGLGLSLSFSIVQRHGGRIELESAPGQGARFRVWVPAAGPSTAETNA
ncbi:MAG: PAS domain-containing protein [Proteobacteria bacterium]|nr:PAS domain-containing protein [Pseudomonadota bacterium]